ncbi:EF-hand domain-containing protein [Paraburkholderia sp. UCT31]|uniref:EF-hand domain-containing protein n=1 Tax=Paraburkholderia sp. UCT31 TaxID=2615209 RepID=UPI001656293E|nr:EF-hand domain-containing protein [Paraburkholderia sp. UCT31]MBC8740348.1 EF-hand domain-containing protein [Paraburkholderia sp. UCT31]
MVTLTPGAQGLASLAAAAITVETESFASMGLKATDFRNANTPAQISELWQKVAKATSAPHGPVSQSDFENFASKLGATKDEADQMFKGFDTNQDGLISNDEFLVGLASTLKDGSSSFAQSILRLMDTNQNGSVDASEFGTLESSFVHAEKPAG